MHAKTTNQWKRPTTNRRYLSTAAGASGTSIAGSPQSCRCSAKCSSPRIAPDSKNARSDKTRSRRLKIGGRSKRYLRERRSPQAAAFFRWSYRNIRPTKTAPITVAYFDYLHSAGLLEAATLRYIKEIQRRCRATAVSLVGLLRRTQPGYGAAGAAPVLMVALAIYHLWRPLRPQTRKRAGRPLR